MTSHDDLRKLAMGATSGNWQLGIAGSCNVVSFDGDDIKGIAMTSNANAAFIAAANPQTVLGLLDEIAFLQATVDAAGPMPIPTPSGFVSNDEVAALRTELKAYQIQTAAFVAKHAVALADLAAMTAARDEACDLIMDFDGGVTHKKRIAELRAVGKAGR